MLHLQARGTKTPLFVRQRRPFSPSPPFVLVRLLLARSHHQSPRTHSVHPSAEPRTRPHGCPRTSPPLTAHAMTAGRRTQPGGTSSVPFYWNFSPTRHPKTVPSLLTSKALHSRHSYGCRNDAGHSGCHSPSRSLRSRRAAFTHSDKRWNAVGPRRASPSSQGSRLPGDFSNVRPVVGRYVGSSPKGTRKLVVLPSRT